MICNNTSTNWGYSNDGTDFCSHYNFGCIIEKVEIIAPKKVVRVTFVNGDIEKAVCDDDDDFSLERGIEVCVLKYFLGGTKEYNNLIRKGVKIYFTRIEKELADLEEQKRVLIKKQKRAIKRKEKLEEKYNQEREEQIQIQTEAYLRAMHQLKEEKRKYTLGRK